jgi:hypothetical protein
MAQQYSTQSVSRRMDDLSSLNPQAATPNVGFDTRTSALKGSEYLNDTWLLGGIRFKGEKDYLENLTIRYNNLKHVLEIQREDLIKVASTDNIDGFYIVGPSKKKEYKSAVNYKDENGEKLKGFLEVIEDGKYQYIRHNTAYVKNPDYKEEFHMGSMDYEITHTSTDYIADNNVLFPVKDFIKAKKKSNPELKKFIRINSLIIKEKDHVAKMIEFLNQNES